MHDDARTRMKTELHRGTTPAPRTARLFRNGTNQAVRLPRDLEIDAEEVLIHRDGNRIVLTPKPRFWDDYFSGGRRLAEDFPETIDDAPAQPREDF
jgi:antitoxin VapB